MNSEQGHESTGGQQQSRPWGFWLVLAAIVLVTVVYSVTMFTIGPAIKTPATAIGAMTAAFAVIGTLVGTYFGIKAGLDGQDKAKETVSRALGEREDRLRVHTERDGDRRSARQPAEEVSTERDGDRRREGQAAEEQRRGTRELRERRRGEPEERQGWEGESV